MSSSDPRTEAQIFPNDANSITHSYVLVHECSVFSEGKMGKIYIKRNASGNAISGTLILG